MPKKAVKRRQKRRQQHQATQEALRSETRAVLAERVEAVREALAELAAVGTDPAVPAADVASMAAQVTTGEGILGGLLGSSQLADSLAGEIVEDAGAARAGELAAAMEPHVAENVDVAWFALALAEEAGDLDLAARIGARAFEGVGGRDDEEAGLLATQLASIRWRQGRLGDALTMAHEWCARWPEGDDLMVLRARLIAHAVALESDDPDLAAVFPYPVDEDQRAGAVAALDRFSDRDLLHRLRRAVEAFIDADPVLSSGRDRYLAEFFEEAAGAGAVDAGEDTAAVLAAERYWLHDEAEDPGGETSVVGQFWADDATPPDLADAARQWFNHVRYGLWLGDWEGAAGSPRGLWLTDIVTRRRIYASIPAAQLDGVPRWTVLAGALAPVDGVWHSGRSLVALDPTRADEVAETVLVGTDRVLIQLFREQGMKPPRPGPDQRGDPPPHGVLSDLLDPMEPPEADLAPKVLGSSLAHVVALSDRVRRRGVGEPAPSRRIDPASAAWIDRWATEEIPALGGVTPTAAAGDPRRAILLEKLLRQFEHDADVAAAAGEPVMDIAALRQRLGLERGVYDVVFADDPS